jgi:hypothetical protein
MFTKHLVLGPSALVLSLFLVGCGVEVVEQGEDIGSAELASHSWGNYHWARTSNPFTLKLGDNVSSAWDSYLATTSSDWTQSTVLNTTIVAGSAMPKTCKPTAGMVQVCNATYGANGWLGIASIWASGSHITQGTVKLNDTYFNTATYNTPAWRNLVTCQEVGHTFGLSHNDEDFNTTNGTCMDYSNDPVPNQHPNAHDYSQLQTIYQHVDSTTTVSSATSVPPAVANANLNALEEWGDLEEVSQGGKVHTYVRELGDTTMITTVMWAE